MSLVRVLYLTCALLCFLVSVVANPAVDEIMSKTFYELFDIKPDSDHKAIKKAFRNVSMKYHPDKASDEADRIFRETVFPRYSLANTVLLNERKKMNYDRLLEIGKLPQNILDHHIDNAWNEERNMWTDELNWAPLEDWHALILVFGVSIVALGLPYYITQQKRKEKIDSAERARVNAIKRIKKNMNTNAN